MGILGKILLVFNLIAGGAFVYLAVQDWGKRQALTAAVLRHRLALQGLPLESADIPNEEDPEIPFEIEITGGQNTSTVSKKFLEVYFQENKGTSKLGGSEVVHNQLAEVRRVRQKVTQLVDAADGPAARAAVAAEFLVMQSETLDERVAVENLKAAGNDQELKNLLSTQFDAVLDKSKTKDETERRIKLAHLLMFLDTDAVWQKRVSMVIGLRRYGPTLAVQTARLDLMFTQVQRQIERDQFAYSAAMDTLWEQATYRTLEVMDSEKRKRAFQAQEAQDKVFLERVKTQVDQLTSQFDQVKTRVDLALVQQTNVEDKLFALQQTVGALLSEMFRLEAELAQREIDRARLAQKANKEIR
jgi:hypothetical protein